MKYIMAILLIIGVMWINFSFMQSHSRAIYAGQYIHDYQIDVTQEGYTIYDSDREVGFVPHGQPIDSLVESDNQ